jgi:uncharacterized membrane protein YhiD involved in acid resistance
MLAAFIMVIILIALPGSRDAAPSTTGLPDNEFTRIIGSVRELMSPSAYSLPVVFSKLLLAALLGAIIGYRQRLHVEEYILQAHVIIAFTGALMMIIIGNEIVRAFGLLGAGSIVRYRTPVRDPKSLASLFVVMAVGIAVGTGLYELAFVGTVLIVSLQGIAATVVRWVPPTLYNPQRVYRLSVITEDGDESIERIKRVFVEADIHYRLLEYDARAMRKDGHVKLTFSVEAGADKTTEDLTRLVMHEGIQSVDWQVE